MKRFIITLCVLLSIHSGYCKVSAQNIYQRDSITEGAYTLIFINNDSAFGKDGNDVKKDMVDVFFKVYPEEVAVYNSKASKEVIFIIDPTYDGVAATTDSVVTFNPHYMLGNPTDVDVVTHEVMHIVQAYGKSTGPGWLTEGIADFARYKFGLRNKEAGWSMPDYQKGQSYTDSYRITARFLAWLEKRRPYIVLRLNSSMRNHTYSGNIWKQLTGQSLDDLWYHYTISSSI